MKQTITLFFLLSIFSISAQWKSLNGPNGGIIYSYENEGISTFVSSSNGFYKSDDSGSNWSRFNNDLPEFYEALGFAVKGDEIFLNYKDICNKDYHFVHSTDRGNHWIQLPLALPDFVTYDLAYSNGFLVAYSSTNQDNKLLESNDNGLTWKISSLDNNLKNIKAVVSNDSYFFVSNQKMLYRRAVNDTSWQLMYTSPSTTYFDVQISSKVIILTNQSNSAVRSTNNGASWNYITIYGTNGNHSIADFGNIMYFGLDYLYKSYDRGLTWEFIRKIKFNDLSFHYLMRTGNSLMANTVDLGLVKTDDEFDSVYPSSKGIYGSEVNRIIATDSFLFALRSNSIHRYNLITKNWDVQSPFLNSYLGNFCYYGGKLFVLSFDTMYVSNDQGMSFKSRSIGFVGPPFYNRNKFFAQNGILVYSYDAGIRYSYDIGESWSDLTLKDKNKFVLSAYDIAYFDKKWIVLAYDAFGVPVLYQSTDFVYWEKFPDILPNTDPSFDAYEVLTTEDNLFVKVTINHICTLIKYLGAGKGFVNCASTRNLCASNYIGNLIVSRNDKMIITTDNGLFQSEDTGLHWTKVIDNLSEDNGSYITCISLKDDKFYAGTYSLGAVESVWNDVQTNQQDLQKEHEEKVTIIPNPNNGKFRIFGENLKNNQAELIRVYNVQGQLVYEKLDHVYNGYLMDLSELDKGIYFLKLGNSNSAVEKIIIQD